MPKLPATPEARFEQCSPPSIRWSTRRTIFWQDTAWLMTLGGVHLILAIIRQ